MIHKSIDVSLDTTNLLIVTVEGEWVEPYKGGEHEPDGGGYFDSYDIKIGQLPARMHFLALEDWIVERATEQALREDK